MFQYQQPIVSNIHTPQTFHSLFNTDNPQIYAYKITSKRPQMPHESLGVLCSYQPSFHTEPNTQHPRILPHENVYQDRVLSIGKTAEKDKTIIPPSYWTTTSINYPENELKLAFSASEHCIHIDTDDAAHCIKPIDDHQLTCSILEKLNQIPHFLIADGHHRYAASQRSPFHFPVFITPHSQAKVRRFNLYLHPTKGFNYDHFINKLRHKGFGVAAAHLADLSIAYKERKLYFSLQENQHYFNSLCNCTHIHPECDHPFHTRLLRLFKSMPNLECAYSESEELCSNDEHKHDQHDERLLVQLAAVDKASIYEHALNAQLLPKKSTCFLFKPAHINIQTLAYPNLHPSTSLVNA